MVVKRAINKVRSSRFKSLPPHLTGYVTLGRLTQYLIFLVCKMGNMLIINSCKTERVT